MKVYLQIFAKTAAALALSALLAAQGFDWAGEPIASNAAVLGWSLLGAAIGGLIAAGWAFVSSPATTPAGKALRSAVQALISAPLASVVYKSLADVEAVSDLVVPTLVYMVLAFFVSYLGNFAGTSNAPVGADFVGKPTSSA